MKQLSKIPSLVRINLKIIASNRAVIISFILFTVLLSIICASMISDYEEKSSIPVGVVDLDQTSLSKSVVEELSNLEGVVLQYGSEEEILKKLKEESIYSYFVINKGFEASIQRYEYAGLVKMVYLKENRFVSILSDIFAQAMIDDIVKKDGERLYKTFKEYEDLDYTVDYEKFIQDRYHNVKDSFAFQYQYYNVSGQGVWSSKSISNTMISTEMFLALGAIYLVFFVMQLIAALDKSNPVKKRTRLSLVSIWTMELADLLTLLLIESIMTILVLWYLVSHLSIVLSGQYHYLIGIVCTFMFVATFFFVTLRRILLSKIVYQFSGFLIILFLGGFSILELLGQLKVSWISDFAKNIPNYWFIKGITDIILGGKTITFAYMAYPVTFLLLAYGIVTSAKYKKLEK